MGTIVMILGLFVLLGYMRANSGNYPRYRGPYNRQYRRPYKRPYNGQYSRPQNTNRQQYNPYTKTFEAEQPKVNLQDMPYKERYILTKNEYIFYNELKKIAEEMGWIICPKVGLKELFEVTTKEGYMTHFGRISQKHVDFIICKNDLKPIFAIELDDNSHNTDKAKQSDAFKNEIFKKSSVKLVRIKACREYSKEYIMRNLVEQTS